MRRLPPLLEGSCSSTEIGGIVAGLVLALSLVSAALGQDAGTRLSPASPRAADEAPPVATGQAVPRSSGPATTSTSTGSAGVARHTLSRAELARLRLEERAWEERARRERERRQAALLAARTEAARQAGFAAFAGILAGESRPAASAGDGTAAVPADDVDLRPAGHRDAGSSSFAAVPILLGLAGAALLLLGLAALPQVAARHSELARKALDYRFEIGLLGTTLLASAALGLLVSNVGR